MAAQEAEAVPGAGRRGRPRMLRPPAVRAARAIRRLPKPPRAVRRPGGGQKILFAAWAAAVGMTAVHDVILIKDWPCPGRYVKITGLFLLLGLMSEISPQAAKLASMLGVGFTLAYFTREASKEIVKSGTFFGIKVK